MKQFLAIVLAALITTSCGMKAKDVIKIVAEAQAPPTNSTPPSTPAPLPAPAPVPEPVPVAVPVVPEVPFQNLNVRVFDADGRAPIAGASVENLSGFESRVTDGSGFANFGVRIPSTLRVSATDYLTQTRADVLPGSTVDFLLVSTKPKPAPPVDDSFTWSDERWHQEFQAILKKHKAPRTVNLQTLIDTRADIEALGAEWQHSSDGTLRPRLFLPTSNIDPFSRGFDMGLYGEPWQWIKR